MAGSEPVRFAAQARRDLVEAARWLVGENPQAARALRGAVRSAAERLGAQPRIGFARPDLAPEQVRFLALSGFPYILVYASELDPPVVLRGLDGARDLPEVLRDFG